MDRVRIGLDVEIDTLAGSLVPGRARVISIAVYSSESDFCVFNHTSEQRMLDGLAGWLREHAGATIDTWNGGEFDLPVLAARAVMSGSSLRVELHGERRPTLADRPRLPQTEHVEYCGHRDLLPLWRPWAAAHFGTARLKVVARQLGLAPVELDPRRLHLRSRKEIAEYNLSDARVTWRLGAIWDAACGEPAELDRLIVTGEQSVRGDVPT